jgi:CRISPR-associated endonuclease Cas2
MNALLSFLYSMWMNDCRSACEAAGLDPQLGFLHAVRPGRASLALDLMEEFRPWADRLALTLINRGQLSPSDFVEREGGAVLLEGDARKAVVVAYQERKQDALTHPLLAESVPLGVVPLVQARLLARHVRGEAIEYPPFVMRWNHARDRVLRREHRKQRRPQAAAACGQRVQKSVFECQVTLAQLEELERKLLSEINLTQDCLRLYRLADTRGCEVREHGKFKATDFDAPLVLWWTREPPVAVDRYWGSRAIQVLVFAMFFSFQSRHTTNPMPDGNGFAFSKANESTPQGLAW